MSTSFKSSPSTIFYTVELQAQKNGRRICPTNDDLTSAPTLATPQNSPSTRPACLAAGRRFRRHDA